MRVLPVLLIAGLLAGCGGSEEERPRAAAPESRAAKQTPAQAEAEVKRVFDDYYAALAERDWKRACEGLAPETTAKLRENVTGLGVADPPGDCAGLLGLVYTTADKVPEQKQLLQEILDSAELDSVKVTGDAAIVNWSATVEGRRTPISQSARRIDGAWKLVDVTN